jgi:hypothetical protein
VDEETVAFFFQTVSTNVSGIEFACGARINCEFCNCSVCRGSRKVVPRSLDYTVVPGLHLHLLSSALRYVNYLGGGPKFQVASWCRLITAG